MQLYFGGICDRVVTKSHFGHQSQVRAKAWEVDDGVNWEALKTLSNRIQYHVRETTGGWQGFEAYARAPSGTEFRTHGYALKLATQTPWAYQLQPDSKS